MCVGLVVYGPLDDRFGGYRYDPELISELHTAGDDVTAVSLPEWPYRKWLRGNVTAIRRLRALDVGVLLQDELCHPSLVGASALLDDETPVVSVVHHLNLLEWSRAWRWHTRYVTETRYPRSVDAFVFNSETARWTVAAITDSDPNVTTHPAGDHFASFGALPSNDGVRTRAAGGPLRVITVCSLEPRKNVDDLLRGLARTCNDRRLTVVGMAVNADHTGSLSTLAIARGIGNRVTFAGRLSDADLTATPRESHPSVLPSHCEGPSITAVEAMGFDLPAFVSSADGASELVTHREDGFLVSPTDPAEPTDAVALLCRNRRRLQSLTIPTHDRLLAHPTRDETAVTAHSFLLDIAGDAD